VVKIKASGTPVGCCLFSTYEAEKYRLRTGEAAIYTDGLTEVFRGDEEFARRVSLQSSSIASRPARRASGVAVVHARRIPDEVEQSDDMTAVPAAGMMEA